jgi:hypothetical protein
VAEEGETCSSAHLLLIIFVLVAGSLGAAVVEGQGERRCRGLDVQVQPAGEGADMGQVSGAG